MPAAHVAVRSVCVLLCAVLGMVGLGAVYAAPAWAGVGVQAPLDTSAVDEFIEQQRSRHGIPGLSLALIDDGRVAYAKGYGTAGADRAMTEDTPMPVGSITKPFTAVTVLRLVERGLVDLDAPVTRYLPQFEVADPAASQAITVRQLLEHTSGLSDLGYNRVLPPEASLDDVVSDLRSAPLTAPPGSEFHYFNPNYSTLALLVERVTGKRYSEVVDQEITRPLGLGATSGAWEVMSPSMARGHSKLFGFAVPDDPPYRAWNVGAGSVVSTAPELARFGIAVGLPDAPGPSVLTPASLQAMRTPPPQIPGATYGLGWVASSSNGNRVEGHDGAEPGYSGQLFVLPERGRGYAFLVNQEHLLDVIVAFPQLQQGLLDLLTDRPPAEGGLGVRLVGGVLLVAFAVALFFSIRSFVRLRGWRSRGRAMTTGQLARAVAPHFVIPALMLLLFYRVVPVLMGGRAFNLPDIGRYFLPDVTLLLLLAVIPDLVQGVYMLAAAVTVRRRSAHHATRPAPDLVTAREERP